MQPLQESLSHMQQRLRKLEDDVVDSELDFAFEQEQLAYQMEGLLADLEESIATAISIYGD